MLSSRLRSAKHIKMCYFWLKDLIDEEEIALKNIPSEELVADLLTKAITGAKFKYLRAKLLGERARTPMKRSNGKLSIYLAI